MLLFPFTLTQTLLFTLYIIILCVAYVLYAFWVIRIIRLQRALRKSEVLIPLHANKLYYWVLTGVLAVILIFFILMTANAEWMEECIIFSLLIGGLIAVVALMASSRSGIVEDGVFLANKFISWTKCYDYFVDKKKCTIAFSNNVKGGLTLVGATFPQKFDRKDMGKLLLLLDAKKDRFLTNVVVR